MQYYIYQNIPELVARTALVIKGKVERFNPSYWYPIRRVSTDPLSPIVFNQLRTDVVVRVEQLFRGPAEAFNSEILITRVGGPDGEGDPTMMGDEDPLEKDYSYVFFLLQGDSERYVAPGPQGYYKLQDHVLTKVQRFKHNSVVAEQLDGMTLAAFERDFEKLATTK